MTVVVVSENGAARDVNAAGEKTGADAVRNFANINK